MSAEAVRPFYGRFAWAYDLLSARHVAAECAQAAVAFVLGDLTVEKTVSTARGVLTFRGEERPEPTTRQPGSASGTG